MSLSFKLSLRGFEIGAGLHSDCPDARRWAVEFYPATWMVVVTPWWEIMAERDPGRLRTAWARARVLHGWEAWNGRWELAFERLVGKPAGQEIEPHAVTD